MPVERVYRALATFCLCLAACEARAYSVEISQAEVQAAVATVFPIKQQIPFAATVFSNPKIMLVKGSNRVRLAITVNATVANQVSSEGQAEIEGALGYDAGKGEFHLRQPVITALQFEALPPDYLDMVKAMVNSVAQQILPNVVIYRLDEQDFRQGMMRRMLKDVSVRDGKLVAELDW